jgi:hypothetical protein
VVDVEVVDVVDVVAACWWPPTANASIVVA